MPTRCLRCRRAGEGCTTAVFAPRRSCARTKASLHGTSNHRVLLAHFEATTTQRMGARIFVFRFADKHRDSASLPIFASAQYRYAVSNRGLQDVSHVGAAITLTITAGGVTTKSAPCQCWRCRRWSTLATDPDERRTLDERKHDSGEASAAT